MATKQVKKAGAAKVTLSLDVQVALCREAGAAKGAELSNRAVFDAAAKKLRDGKAKIGDARTCKNAQAFIAGRFGDVKKLTQVMKNALAGFRAAVNEGKAYTENAARAKKAAAAKAGKAAGADVATDAEAAETEDKPAKGKTHVGTAETATTYACTIARKGSAAKASQTLRDLLNKMRGSEEYAQLALLVIDALNEFDGTAE